MGYEVDMLAVGNGECSGDAICLRFGDLFGERQNQFVMVIDGGTQESGAMLVDRIKTSYHTELVDLVVSTHPDDDHVSGLRNVLEDLTVGRLWMHLPWRHAADFRALFKDLTLTDIGLRRSIRKALDTATELEEIARRKSIPIDEPFSDALLPFGEIGIRVLGPGSLYYASLLPQFRETPAALIPQPGLLQRAASAVAEAVKWIAESWWIETLGEPEENATSAENNSSVILTLFRENHRLLFTGDAGVPALTRAAAFAELQGFHLPSSRLVQVPHHGSRRNVGPAVLDRLLGPKYQEPSNAKTVYASAGKEAPKHPSRKVTNAFQRRGAKGLVYATKGTNLWHHHEAPDRGWATAVPLPFFEQVEEE